MAADADCQFVSDGEEARDDIERRTESTLEDDTAILLGLFLGGVQGLVDDETELRKARSNIRTSIARANWIELWRQATDFRPELLLRELLLELLHVDLLDLEREMPRQTDCWEEAKLQETGRSCVGAASLGAAQI